MSDKQADQENVYKKYSIRSEHALWVTDEKKSSNIWIDGKPWVFTYENEELLQLKMSQKESYTSAAEDNKTTAAEILFWYWNDKKEIVILHQKVHDDFSNLIEKTTQMPIDESFDVVIRLLDKRKENDNNGLLESYYGDMEKVGIEMVTLRIVGTKGETEASFTIPKVNLVQASPVFYRMFTAEMTEKATGEVEIKDTNAEEFGDFLKAISPKQEHPNPSNVRSLLKLADRYECQLLIDRCEAHLTNCIELPLDERINCANIYGLKKLKDNLLMNIEGTGILELYQDTKPYHGLLHALTKMID